MKADSIISLDHGSGGLASQNLISDLFLKYLTSPQLRDLEDCAVLGEYAGRLAFSTDSFVVDPLFFPGGDIGELAVHGTINDLAMRGARPIALSLALIIEEGFPLADLERIIASVARCCEAAGVAVVTGDTKVVPRGKADGMFINTSGIGIVSHRLDVSVKMAVPGDTVLLSGTLADHGITIMSRQAGIDLDGDIFSDTQPLHRLVGALLESDACRVHVLRDPTRGGVATALCEIARASKVDITIEEERLPIMAPVATACELIGLDPLYLANEGKCLIVCAREAAEDLLQLLRQVPEGRGAARIGRISGPGAGQVTLTTRIGGSRLLEPLTGQSLPRIC
ncbi:hydrogenase expression/formation protein HypE [Desulfobulbus alkaliphilus]|uniref:hydrogenase expression/formation protein HypE n=1 Tax=Desulfobulbus alkaliphilus TaxID=869814 RepID=UPI0019635589|nr:hydrogenase expression/formation protein HypE [Desulfobulbus alkaliphilus]MBM9535573.1 hydrogenase expression/formation protein HypE [Desulfobulbus alkaliphilus]